MNDRDRALDAFERVLAVNPANVRAMTQAGAVLAKKECYPQAVAYLQRAIGADSTCGEAWAVLAHCYVMTDDLQKAYQAYQNALSHLPNPRDPNLWYGIGLLYDRYGSLDHALEAFLLVLSIAPDFERADEVCFCIGIIYKEQQNFEEALRFFNKVVVAANPPPPLTRADGWYQIGHVSELKRDIPAAFDMYRQALNENPKHPKTLQNLGWLEYQHNNNSAEAIRLLKLSSELDSTDGQTWYLLGRVYMALREFRQAYDAYQQAVYRDGRNATFWCSIGVLYYQMNQYSDAMDAYSRAIKLNPYVSEVWYDLGTLYESCSQNEDAIEAYRRAAELAPDNSQITDRLAVLESSMSPTAIQQQQQHQQGPNQQGQQPSISQPAQSVPQPIPSSQPQQMHPEMQHNQHHVISQLNPISSGRSIDQPLPFSQPISSQRPSHQPSSSALPQGSPHPHVTSQGASTQGRQVPGSPVITSTGGNAPPELSSIPSMRQQSMSENCNGNGSATFQRDGRPSLPPGPLPSLPLPEPLNNSSANHLSPLASQPLMNPSNGLTQVHGPNRETMNGISQAQSNTMVLHPRSSHASLHDGSMRQHSAGPYKDQDRLSVHPDQDGGQMSSPKSQQRSINSQQNPRVSTDQNDAPIPSLRTSGYDQNTEEGSPRQQPIQGRPPVSSPQKSHHSLQNQSASSIPQLHALPQIQDLTDGQVEKSDRHRLNSITDDRERERNNSFHENVPSASQYTLPDPSRRHDFDGPGQGERESCSLPKLSESDGSNGATNVALHGDSTMHDVGSGSKNHSLAQSPPRERIPSMREAIGDNVNSVPTSRQGNFHDASQSESRDENLLHGSRRHENSQRDDGDRMEQDERDNQLQSIRSDANKPERLPGLSSLPSPMDMTSPRAGLNDQDRPNTLPQPSAPTLPSSNPLPSISSAGNGKLSSPSHRNSPPSVSGIGVAGVSLPPLSGRGSGAMNRFAHDSKELNVPAGISSGLSLATSSLTKFGAKGIGRAPSTPNVSNSGVPSSLPSPLPTRKAANNTSGVHAVRSPKSKPSPGASFKALPVPVPKASFGQHDTVPSPGSLPVLPALSPHRRTYEEEEKGAKDSLAAHDSERENERRIQNRSTYDESVDKESRESDGHGRVASDTLENKPVFGVLRPEPSGPEKDGDLSENEEKIKSPSTSGGRSNSDNLLASKRDSISKEDLGRTPKRPRLLEGNEKEGRYDGRTDGDKAQEEGSRKDEMTLRSNSCMNKSDVSGSFHEVKSERRSSGSPDDSLVKHHRRENNCRSSDGDAGKNSLSNQMIDLPRLSNQAMPKLSGPLLSGNTPLPSFRSERKIITATRSSGGPGSLGKSTGDGVARGSLTFALRSAPVSSIVPLKSIGGGTSGRSNGDHNDYSSSPRIGDASPSKRMSEDKADGSIRNSMRDRE